MPPVARRQFLGAAAATGMCKGGPTPGLRLAYAGSFTETVPPGVLARRMQWRLECDQATLRVRNLAGANRYLRKEYRPGWF